MSVIFDPVHERRILDIVTTECEWLRRQVIETPIFFTDFRNGRMVGVQNLDVPEVIVYQAALTNATRARSNESSIPRQEEESSVPSHLGRPLRSQQPPCWASRVFAAGQEECPVACFCNPPLGCQCVTLPEGGGFASDCVAGGMTSCNLIYCYDPQDPGGLVYTPDGTVLRVADVLASDTSGTAPDRDAPALRGRWSTESPGHAVARNCTGIIVARYFTPEAAAAVRQRIRKMTV